MGLGVLLLVLTGASPAIHLAAPGLQSVNVEKGLAGFYSDHLAQQLRLGGVQVITASEISQLLGFERQKQLMGCSEQTSSCMAELANALGVDGIVTGNLARLGDSYQLDVNVLAARDGHPLGTFSVSADDQKGLLAAIDRRARDLVGNLRGPPVPAEVVSVPAATVTEAPPRAIRRWAWLPAATGVVLGAAGAYCFSVAASDANKLKAHQVLPDPVATYNEGKQAESLGTAFVAVGGAHSWVRRRCTCSAAARKPRR